jgi:hypothetical protein
MRYVLLSAVLAAAPVSPALSWGQTGHRVTGAIAEQNLSGLARARIRTILGDESLAEASTWPDEMRSDPAEFWQKTANPWHYVTVPRGRTYREVGPPPEGDAASALQRFAATLRDPNASREQKQLALRFTVHIIGDLHQPLHAGNATDRGGNDVKVTSSGNNQPAFGVGQRHHRPAEPLVFRVRGTAEPQDRTAGSRHLVASGSNGLDW